MEILSYFDKLVWAIITGYFIVGVIADQLISRYADKLWGKSDMKSLTKKAREELKWLPRRVGIIERVIYTSAVVSSNLALIPI
mgnify:CR=1 FL=1